MQTDAPLMTIFTLPKAFTGATGQIQFNSIGSWKALGPQVEVIMIGDEDGIIEAAAELGVKHIKQIHKNDSGTPLVSDAFHIAEQSAQSALLVYCNADVILDDSFITAVDQVAKDPLVGDSFLAIGTRTDVSVKQRIDFSDSVATDAMMNTLAREGRQASICCKEFFAFRKGDFSDIPDFAVGRGNWDNWMVVSAKQRGIPVVRLPQHTRLFHQDHQYDHLDNTARKSASRHSCYVSGAEARENQRLAGGKHIISGATATHRLTPQGVVKNCCVGLHLEFWSDIQRFAALVRDLYFPRKKS